MATQSDDLTVDVNTTRSDSDVLAAAGVASIGNSTGAMVLRFVRLKNGDMGALRDLAETTGKWLHGRSMRGGRKPMTRMQACDMATRVLLWWANPVCEKCAGLKHPLMPNSPVLNTAHRCSACGGTGITPISKIVPHGRADEAMWLVDQAGRYGEVFGRMARLLGG